MLTAKKTARPVGPGRGGDQQHGPQRHQYNACEPLGKFRDYRDWKAQLTWKEAQATPSSRYQLVALLRLAELRKLVTKRLIDTRARFLPNDDAGADDLTIMLNVAAFTGGDVTKMMRGLVLRFAPWLPDDAAARLIANIVAAPRWFTADELGWRMRLGMFEREDLGIKTIGCWELNKEARARLRRIKANRKRREARKSRKRLTISAARPWEAEGISRATWYRKKQKARA